MASRWLARLGQDEGWEQYTWLPWSSGGGVVVYADPQMLDGGPGRDLPPIQMAQVYVEAGSVRRVAMLRAWRRLACDKAGWARRSIVDLPVDLLRQIHAGIRAAAESAAESVRSIERAEATRVAALRDAHMDRVAQAAQALSVALGGPTAP